MLFRIGRILLPIQTIYYVSSTRVVEIIVLSIHA